jgi:hypothetical protein
MEFERNEGFFFPMFAFLFFNCLKSSCAFLFRFVLLRENTAFKEGKEEMKKEGLHGEGEKDEKKLFLEWMFAFSCLSFYLLNYLSFPLLI